MIRALVFDLDGTLVDSLPGIAASVNRVLGEMDSEARSEREVRRCIGNGVEILARRVLGEGANDELVSWFVDAFRNDYGARWAEGTAAYPGIAEALGKLSAAGVPMAVWSNKPHDFTVATVERIFPGFRFATVLGEREGIPRKPDPAAAPEILDALGHPANETAMVGDSPSDIQSGRNAEMITVAVTWGYRDRDQLAATEPDRWVETPDELPNLCLK